MNPGEPTRAEDIDISEWGTDDVWHMLQRCACRAREDSAASVIAVRRHPDDPDRLESMNLVRLAANAEAFNTDVAGHLATLRLMLAQVVIRQAEYIQTDPIALGRFLDDLASDLHAKARIVGEQTRPIDDDPAN